MSGASWRRIARRLWKSICDAPSADMQLMRYQAPDGTRRHTRLWNGGTGRGELRLLHRRGGVLEPVDTFAIGHAGCEYGEYDMTAPYPG